MSVSGYVDGICLRMILLCCYDVFDAMFGWFIPIEWCLYNGLLLELFCHAIH